MNTLVSAGLKPLDALQCEYFLTVDKGIAASISSPNIISPIDFVIQWESRSW